MVTEADRSAWMAANDTLRQLEEERSRLLAPTAAPYEAVKDLIAAIQARTGEPIAQCEDCSQPIFNGETVYYGADAHLCGACAPKRAGLPTHSMATVS